MFQLCPLCAGTGYSALYGGSCEICKGKKIIDEFTGKPPEEVKKF